MRKLCIEFIVDNLSKQEIKGKRVIEIGSKDINGNIKTYFMKIEKPCEYIGIDLKEGNGVDIVCSAENMVEKFGKESFDIVLSTETFEHIKDWKKAISEVKNICKKGGLILITTVCKGFGFHEYPGDFWRYEIEDLRDIFSDCEILMSEMYDSDHAVVIKVRKGVNFVEKDLTDYKLYSMEENMIV